MSIKEVMQIGTSGMTASQKEAEQARRLKVVERINHISKPVTDSKKQNRYKRELRKIKAYESEWLREAAWFLYR